MTVLYTSNTGFTQKYAMTFAKKACVDCLPMNDFPAAEDVIYFGWTCAGAVSGLKKAMKNYELKAVCVVGIKPVEQVSLDEIKKQNNLHDIPVFYLQGGIDMARLKWYQRLIIKAVAGSIEKHNPTDEPTLRVLDAMKNGGSFFNEENISDVLLWYKNSL